MKDQSSFHVTQGLTVMVPRTGKAYPIPCDEWCWIKEKIQRFSSEPWFFHTIGSIFIGAALSTFTTIFLETYAVQNQERTKLIAWGVFAATFVAGFFCLLFAHKERKSKREQSGDVLAQMGLIEQRYEYPIQSEQEKEITN